MSEQGGYVDPKVARIQRDRAMADDYSAGVRIEDIATKAGLPITTAFGIVRRLKAKKPKALCKYHRAPTERDQRLCAEYLSGDSLETVGQRHGITRERVRQILVRNGHDDRHNGFNSERRAAYREKAFPALLEREEKRERRNAQLAMARELYNAGETYRAIAERLNHPITWVQNAIWTTGGPSRNRNVGKVARRITPENRQEIARLYAAGEPPQLIADKFDLSRAVVCLIANRLGAYRR